MCNPMKAISSNGVMSVCIYGFGTMRIVQIGRGISGL